MRRGRGRVSLFFLIWIGLDRTGLDWTGLELFLHLASEGGVLEIDWHGVELFHIVCQELEASFFFLKKKTNGIPRLGLSFSFWFLLIEQEEFV